MLVVVALAAATRATTTDCGTFGDDFKNVFNYDCSHAATQNLCLKTLKEVISQDSTTKEYFKCIWHDGTEVCADSATQCNPEPTTVDVDCSELSLKTDTDGGCGRDDNILTTAGTEQVANAAIDSCLATKTPVDGTSADGVIVTCSATATKTNANDFTTTCTQSAVQCSGSSNYGSDSNDAASPPPPGPPSPAPTPAPDNTGSPTTKSVKAYIQKLINNDNAEFGGTAVEEATFTAMTLNVPAETNRVMDATVGFPESVPACQAEAMIGLIRDHMKNEYSGRDVTVSGCTDIVCATLNVCPAESRFARAAQSARRGRRATERTATINVASKGLNGGEIAGIVIGSVVGAVLIGGLIYSAVTGGSVLAGGKVGGYYRMGDNGIEM